MPLDETQDTGIVSSNEGADSTSKATARPPGDVTKAAQSAARGDKRDSLLALEEKVQERLGEIAARLIRDNDLDVPATELTRGFLDWYARNYRRRIRDRTEFYELAEHQMQQQLPRLAKLSRSRDPARLELAHFVAVREPQLDADAAEQALRQVEELKPFYGRWLRHRLAFAKMELGLARCELFWIELGYGEPPREEEVLALLRGLYRRPPRDSRQEELDSSAVPLYLDGNTLTPQPVPAETPSGQPPADPVESLQRENHELLAERQDLRERLEAAEKRVRELERQLEGEVPDTEVPDTSSTRSEVEALLDQPSLDRVPLLTGGSFERQWGQFQQLYGRWLRHFGAPYDQVSLDHIRAHDPEGLKRLTVLISKRRQREGERYGEARTPTLGEVVPTESEKGDQVLLGKTVEEVLADPQLARTLRSRLGRLLYPE